MTITEVAAVSASTASVAVVVVAAAVAFVVAASVAVVVVVVVVVVFVVDAAAAIVPTAVVAPAASVDVATSARDSVTGIFVLATVAAVAVDSSFGPNGSAQLVSVSTTFLFTMSRSGVLRSSMTSPESSHMI